MTSLSHSKVANTNLPLFGKLTLLPLTRIPGQHHPTDQSRILNSVTNVVLTDTHIPHNPRVSKGQEEPW
jgi:hypothetical protein